MTQNKVNHFTFSGLPLYQIHSSDDELQTGICS